MRILRLIGTFAIGPFASGWTTEKHYHPAPAPTVIREETRPSASDAREGARQGAREGVRDSTTY
jgi:hypothetical protein